MDSKVTQQGRRFDRALSVSLGAGVVLLTIIGIVYATAHGTRQITAQAVSLHSADEMLRASSVARAQIAIAVHSATVDETVGSDSSDVIGFSLDEAERSLQDLQEGLDALHEEIDVNQALEDSVAGFVESGTSVIATSRQGDVETARELVSGQFADGFDDLVSALVELRDGLAASVAAADSRLGRIGDVARFMVAFILPVAVILTHRILARRHARRSALESRLEAEQRVSLAREEFIASASHELRTPLTSITGLAMLLEEDPVIRENENSLELLELIVSESLDLARMVDDLLTSARLDVGALSYSFEDVEMASELRELMDSMQRVGMEVDLDVEPAHVRADRVRLRQVIRNLLSNASRYGGAEIEVTGRKEGKTYVCEVSDNGDGVPEEVAGRLFQKFAHKGLDTASPGSVGLGLSIVQALTQGMGGSVRYERSAGKTSFIVRLPLASWSPSEGPTGDGEAPVMLVGDRV